MVISKFLTGLTITALLAPLWPLYAADSSKSNLRGVCQITERIYSTTNNQDYTLVDSSIVSHTSGDVPTSTPLKLSGHSDPVSYIAKFYQDGRIEGELNIQIDQPGPRIRSASDNFKPLAITLEDTYNGGMATYQLYCSFDVID